MDFTDLCGIEALSGFFDDGCDPASIDPEIVHARVRGLGRAFLGRWLDGDTSFDAYLDPVAANALGNLEWTYERGAGP
jgi:hypothetical protein